VDQRHQVDEAARYAKHFADLGSGQERAVGAATGRLPEELEIAGSGHQREVEAGPDRGRLEAER
jgi:hypothetical protein